MKKRPNGYWHDWANVEAAFRASMEACHGVIPGRKWFEENGYGPALVSIQTYWRLSMDDVRKRLGVYGKKYCPSCERVLDKSEFRIKRNKRSGGEIVDSYRDSTCKACNMKSVAEYRRTTPGRVANAYRSARGRAREFGREFNLTREWIAARLDAIGWKCEETGIPFELGTDHAFKSPYTLSVDRIDSNRGYTTDNVRFVINWVNIAKQDMPNSLFVSLCRKVVDAHEHRDRE